MLVAPWMFDEVIESRPAIVENCFSSGVATEDAIVSGLAPGSDALTTDRREIDVRQIVHRQVSGTPSDRTARSRANSASSLQGGE